MGFVFGRQAAGSHEIWYNEKSDKYTTIPNHPGDMPEGTLRRSSNKPTGKMGSDSINSSGHAIHMLLSLIKKLIESDPIFLTPFFV